MAGINGFGQNGNWNNYNLNTTNNYNLTGNAYSKTAESFDVGTLNVNKADGFVKVGEVKKDFVGDTPQKGDENIELKSADSKFEKNMRNIFTAIGAGLLISSVMIGTGLLSVGLSLGAMLNFGLAAKFEDLI